MSGGIDSTSCMLFYRKQGFKIEGLFIDYGQPAVLREKQALEKLGMLYSVPIKQVQLSGIDIPVLVEIPGRNILFLSVALMYFSESSGIIAIGIHTGTPYYDCSKDFIDRTQQIIDGYAGGKVTIGVPFLEWNKLEVWNYLQKFRLPFGITYSCELGLDQPCGKCSSCKDLEALNAGKNNKNHS